MCQVHLVDEGGENPQSLYPREIAQLNCSARVEPVDEATLTLLPAANSDRFSSGACLLL